MFWKFYIIHEIEVVYSCNLNLGDDLTRNYLKYVQSSHIQFLKNDLAAPISNYRTNVYTLPLFVYSSLFLSHDIRKNVNIFLVLMNKNSRVIQISSNKLRNMRPDFRSIMFILKKTIIMASRIHINNTSFKRLGIRIFNDIEEFNTVFTGYSLIIVGDVQQVEYITKLPRDTRKYLFQIGNPSSVDNRLDMIFPVYGAIKYPSYFELGFTPSILNIELDRSHNFDR